MLLILSSVAYQSLNVVLDEAAGLSNSALRKVCQIFVLNGHKIRLFIYGCIFIVFSLPHPLSGIYRAVVMSVQGHTTFL